MQKKSFLVAGNWKMNPVTVKDADRLAKGVKKYTTTTKRVQTVVFPPVLYLNTLASYVSKKYMTGAQDIFWMESGSYTGQIAVPMIIAMKASHVLLGHSEVRALGETDDHISKKLQTVLKYGLTPILCVGESVRDTEGWYLHTIKKQIEQCLVGVDKKHIKNIVIAYEPIWAIGKNAVREATPNEASEMAIYIKKVLSLIYDTKIVADVRVLYGGSVTSQNCISFLQDGHVDGVLVGRESLDIKKFGKIITQIDAL